MSKKHFKNIMKKAFVKTNPMGNERIEQVRLVNEPHPVCAICGKEIENIASSFADGENNGFVHFDCALLKVGEILQRKPDEKISYVGSGKFAKIKMHSDNKTFDVIDEYEWEKEDTYENAKKYVRSNFCESNDNRLI